MPERKFEVGDWARVKEAEGVEYTSGWSSERCRNPLPEPPGTAMQITAVAYGPAMYELGGNWYFEDELEWVPSPGAAADLLKACEEDGPEWLLSAAGILEREGWPKYAALMRRKAEMEKSAIAKARGEVDD